MRRIAVVGSGGAGKSTFSRALGDALGLPVVHLDEHFWQPGWVETPSAEWRERQAESLAGDEWIVDGNYGGTFDVRFGRADTVIVLDLGRVVCLTRAVRRVVTGRGRAVQAAGCPERHDLGFYRWVWRYPSDARPRLDAALAAAPAGLSVVRLGSRREVASFLADAGVPPGPPGT